MQVTIGNGTIRLTEGDITDLDTDAIVNAANKYLQLGSGVAGAIRRRGGPSIQKECDKIKYCPVGSAVITGGGDLKARHVIHAVGPLGSDPDADELLAGATRTSLQVAAENNLSSIAFPAISTGVFGYPIDKCAHFMIAEAVAFLTGEPATVKEVVFCLYGASALSVFDSELKRQTGG